MDPGEKPSYSSAAPLELSIETLYRDEYPSLVRLAYLVTHDRARAEDATQEAFARVLRRRQPLRSETAPAYLRSVVLNVTRSQHRRDKLSRRLLPRLNFGPASSTDSERPSDLVAAIWELPTRQRECIALYYFSDLALADVASALHISIGSVKTHIHRALVSLRAKGLTDDE